MRTYETFWRALEPLLSRDLERPPALASLLRDARRQASRISNDLGVSLDGRGCDSEAALAYGHALRLDPNNRCASFNRYGLDLRNFSLGASADQESLVLQAAERLERGFLFERCAARYGALRSQPADLLETLNATAAHPLVLQWVAYCQSRATDTLRLPPPADGATPAKENTLELATHAMRAGDLAGAETRLHAFLRAHPDSLSGWSLLAGILLDSGRSAEVASLVRPAMRAAAGESGHELVDLIEGRLALHSAPPRNRDARLFFARALTRHPGLKEAQDHLLQTDLLIGDAALIEADTSDILKADPRHGPANTLLGGIRLAQQRYDEAENHLRRSVASRPSAGSLTDLADLLRLRKNLAEAEKNVRHALRLDPDFFLAWDTLGSVLADQNRLVEAETAIGRALSLGANDLRPRLTWAKLNLRLRRTSEARQILTQAEPMVASASAAAGNDFASLSKELEELAGQR
jgi:Flp pilus assembly protein TadD